MVGTRSASPRLHPGPNRRTPATAERLIELERQAAQATRQPAAYTDITVSFSKSISVLHASIRENERRARLAGDQQATAYWAGQEEAFQEVLHRANRAALKYLQAWAERIPGVPDPDRRAYLAQIAAMMDDRTNASARMPPGPSPPGRSRLSARCQTIRPPGRSGSARQR